MLWLMRSGLRVGALLTALCLPVIIGGLISGTPALTLALCVIAVGIYLTLWMALTIRMTSAVRTGAYNLTTMLGVWLLFCVVVPATLTKVIERVVPLPNGGEILLAQREAVNDAWDLPRTATYEPFLARHTEWTNHTAWNNEDGFEWKWYYAFQQVGDQTVEALSQSYRAGQAKRDELANCIRATG